MVIDIFKILIYSALPSLIALYLTERLKGKVKSNFDSKLEKLKNEHSIELSKFQAEINSLKTREDFKFTKLHEKRFLILEESYKLLNQTLSKLTRYIAPVKQLPQDIKYEDNEDKLHGDFIATHDQFTQHFSYNKIYFDKHIEKLMEDYIFAMHDIYDDYQANHILRKLTSNPDHEISQKAYQAYKKVPEKLLPIKKEIENKFRQILER